MTAPEASPAAATVNGHRAARDVASQNHTAPWTPAVPPSTDTSINRVRRGRSTEPTPAPAKHTPGNSSTPTVADIARIGGEILDTIETAVVGHRSTLTMALAAFLAGGHVLLEDVPGIGKTLTARSLAQTLGLEFSRLQCTPDLLPADVTGSFVYDPGQGTFIFHEGPLFAGLLLADEINRTPPKTQSALLEAMQEGQVTVEGCTYQLPQPFHVVATSNPIEYEGTYPLPEAQLDRFMVRLSFGYPNHYEEISVVTNRLARRSETVSLDPVIDAEGLAALQRGVEAVAVDHDVVDYCVGLVHATRQHHQVEVGVSPRGATALVLMARAFAVLDGRDVVVPEDAKACALSVLSHRMTLVPETWSSGRTAAQVVQEVLETVATPSSTRSSVVAPTPNSAQVPTDEPADLAPVSPHGSTKNKVGKAFAKAMTAREVAER